MAKILKSERGLGKQASEVILGAVHIFTSSLLNVHWTLIGGEGVEESQDLDVKVGILGQNQNNALRKHILLMLITEHEEKNVPP